VQWVANIVKTISRIEPSWQPIIWAIDQSDRWLKCLAVVRKNGRENHTNFRMDHFSADRDGADLLLRPLLNRRPGA
jgi:hypothetical protein